MSPCHLPTPRPVPPPTSQYRFPVPPSFCSYSWRGCSGLRLVPGGQRSGQGIKRRWLRSRVAAPVRGVSSHFVICHQHTHTHSQPRFPPFLRQTAAGPDPTPCQSSNLTAREGRMEGGSAAFPLTLPSPPPRPQDRAPPGWGWWDADWTPPPPGVFPHRALGQGTLGVWVTPVGHWLCPPQPHRVSSPQKQDPPIQLSPDIESYNSLG